VLPALISVKKPPCGGRLFHARADRFEICRFARHLNHFPKESVMSNNEQARVRAEAMFKRKQEQASEATQAWEEYQAQSRVIAERTKRLRELRLAKEAAQAKHAG
jgi:hypothetical protein